MMTSRNSLYVSPALTGGVLAALLAPAAARAQCATPASSFSSALFGGTPVARTSPQSQ